MAKKILIVIPPVNYRDEELEIPKKHFEGKGFEVVIASTKKGVCHGSIGGTAEATVALGDVAVDEYDAIVFVGGGGTPLIRKEAKALEIARDAIAQNKVLAAICWAPTILAKAGALKGKKAACWFGPDSEFGISTGEYIERSGGKYVKDGVAVDGKIVTADGPRSAKRFAEEIEKLLH
ncbi:DJ-1/PfpI family protein [Candidatus Micrarchaeota archaeon]|nr:DJ-1/PfpI family protein [Candidatus Micrarchaeota archaeon]